MIRQLNIRPENESDISRIEYIIISAFRTHPHSNHKEHFLVTILRNQGALSVSLVAESEEKLVGHIAFSEVTINGENQLWYGLAPVSVDPEYQNRGIGSKLIYAGLEAIKKLGAKGCVLLGEPDYYGQFGFKSNEKLWLADVPPEYFLTLLFVNEVASGRVEYHKAFTEYG